MDAILYSWLSAATIAPFVAILSAWTLIVFWSYRYHWRLMDLFLFSLSAHEILSALFGFGFAVLSLIRPLLDTPCCSIIWGLAATRTFHVSVVTSLILERAITVHKSHTFRANMRRSHVRYHIAVLAIIAVIVGMTSVFARLSSSFNGFCSLHPLAWNIQFSVFTVSVYGILLLSGFVGFILTQVKKVDDQKIKEFPGLSWDSRRSTSTSNSSGQLENGWSDCPNVEWKAVACICWLSYLTNHGPFVVMTVMGLSVPTFWSPWLDNATIWLRLAQGCLIPLALVVFDVPFRSALRNMLRQRGRVYRHLSAENSRLRLKIENFLCYTDGISPPHRLFSDNVGRPFLPLFQTRKRSRWSSNNLHNLHRFHQNRSLNRIHNLHSFEKPSFTPWKVFVPDPHAHDTLGSYCSLSFPSSDGKLIYSSSDDVVSITTDAFDDFDFLAGSSRHLDYEGRSVLPKVRHSIYPHICTIFPKLFEFDGGPNLGNGNEFEPNTTGYMKRINRSSDSLKSSMDWAKFSNLPKADTVKANVGEEETVGTTSDTENLRMWDIDELSVTNLDDNLSYHSDPEIVRRFSYPFSSANRVAWENPFKLYAQKRISPYNNIYDIYNSPDLKKMNGAGISYLSGVKQNLESYKSFVEPNNYFHVPNETCTRQRMLFSEYP